MASAVETEAKVGTRLAGKVAIVTGAASGFGAGIARRFVGEGAKVVIADLNGDGAEALAKELGEAARGVRADVSHDGDVAALAAAATAFGGGIDIVVNNAGVGQLPKALESVDEAEFDRLFNINAKSVYLTARHVVPVMKAAKAGAILNIASTGGVSPRPNLTWYNSTKGWMITATRAMAIELARYGIRVNAINPVAGDTPLLATFMGGEDTDEGRQRILSTIPLRRLSTPTDIANAAVFLCSDEASMITGVAMEVDGGRCLSNPADEDKLLAAIDGREEDVVALTQALVRIPSVNPPGEHYRDCVELVGERLKPRGFELEYVRAEGAPATPTATRAGT